ncbi:transcription elongation factor Spt5 [Candidatus Micrarchaeota archaeon]|mgnify:CR=1 FL=1|nr:MAG: transcription elongation factor Spt5 [Candidatus Micrarchaeota archaeon]
MLFGVRVTIGQEKVVAEALKTKMKKEKEDIYSISIIDGLRGYIIVEAANEAEVRKLTYRVPHIKGVIAGAIKSEELEHFFETKSLTKGIERGDIVELTSGAFKGEKAKVIRVDEGKEKVTVEIIEAAVPIPITVDASNVRLIASSEKEEEK